MKRTYIFLCILTAALATSCDVIEGSYTEGGSGEVSSSGRIVLLEEYSGVRCVNCPKASLKAEALQESFGKNMVLVSIHPEGNSLTIPMVDTIDYRVATSGEWANYYGITGIPKGIVNRQNTQLDEDAWESAINAELAKEKTVDIVLSAGFRPSDRTMEITATSTFLTDLEDDFYLQVCLTEDSLRSPQRNNDSSIGGNVITDFAHNHVLRSMVNGTWGEPIAEGKALRGQAFTKNYTITIPDEYDIHNCTVVAFVFRNSNKVVEQAQECRAFTLLY